MSLSHLRKLSQHVPGMSLTFLQQLLKIFNKHIQILLLEIQTFLRAEYFCHHYVLSLSLTLSPPAKGCSHLS